MCKYIIILVNISFRIDINVFSTNTYINGRVRGKRALGLHARVCPRRYHI